MVNEIETRECPYCKEEIKADAVKCKHCRSVVKPKVPVHGGTCPYCKEAIKPEAVKCKHCGSMVGDSAESSCCEGCAETSGGSIASGAGFPFAQLAGGNSIDPTATSTIAASKPGCTSCFLTTSRGPFGQTIFNGNRLCCVKIPVLTPTGIRFQTVCWTEQCNPFEGNSILV
jgi:hypothetical protein